ncbi:MAG: 2-oxoglutarate dehydrogenase E1 component [Chloroflexi bacterium]|nr:2-oxoglutarate dehydrogenase E1 component [Chloroflexota bacterium]
MRDFDRFTGPNAGYVAELYELYLIDPESVAPDLRAYFAKVARGMPAAGVEVPGTLDAARRLGELVRAIRNRGHLAAHLDPLGIRKPVDEAVDPAAFGLDSGSLRELPARLIESPAADDGASAFEAVARLRAIYCSSVGYDFAHLTGAEEQRWLVEAVESGRFAANLDAAAKRDLLTHLSRVEAFEQFLGRSFPGQKWFSVEGNDVLIPVLDELIRNASRARLRHVVLGMAHRGRLNVLAHIMDKAYDSVLAEFMEGYYERESESSDWGWMRDVKYHLGASTTRTSTNGGSVRISLLANPSHVELVNPVVAGAVRALQEDGSAKGPDPDAALGILMHGDAAFAGQGIVAETFNMSQLRGFQTAGTIHIVVNNQIGFTTEPEDAQSTRYASDLAKGYDVPIAHVNADDPEAALSATRLAFAYRQRFRKDFVVDLIGYRRHGHNEGDEPSFTQPRMYSAIESHPTVGKLWARRLVEQGVLAAAEAGEFHDAALKRLQAARDSITLSEYPADYDREPVSSEGRRPPEVVTAVAAERLIELNKEIHRLPEGFNLHSKIERPFKRRLEALEGGKPIDWAHAESLAFASILADGIPIRISGQDTERGTFSQRHAVLHDVKSGEGFLALAGMPSAKAAFAIFNSPLSEAGVLGYEYGYSVKSPRSLVLWEAQFGDFVNNAQSVVDELIVSAHAKWGQASGLVLLLPHGYEGQGPNHSSAHLERFLHLAAGENIQIASCTTAGQYFHLLRRQALRLGDTPKPLVVMTAKSLLRHPAAASSVTDLAEGSFLPLIDDPRHTKSPSRVRRLVFCTGKVFVDLISSDEYSDGNHVAVVRIEELYPFPVERIAAVLERYDRVEDVVWLQEESQNRGAWSYVGPRLHALLRPETPLTYVGRPDRPSPAVGSLHLHKMQQAELIRRAISEKTRSLRAAS